MKDKGNAWIIAGVILILISAMLTGYNLLDSRQAQNASAAAVTVLKDQLPPTVVATPELTDPACLPEELPDFMRFPDMEMPVVIVEERAYVGMIEIPVLELALPVLDDWNYPALKVAPCRYEGSAYTGDLIVMAHNYDSHFGKLRQLQPEDEVRFTDMAGNVFTYRVIELETLPGSAVEDMSEGQWDLTLFTCTYGGQSRVTIRCRQV